MWKIENTSIFGKLMKIEIKCPAIGILPNLKCELRFAAQSQTLPASPSTGVTVLVHPGRADPPLTGSLLRSASADVRGRSWEASAGAFSRSASAQRCPAMTGLIPT